MYSDVYAACNMNMSWVLLQEEHLKHFQRMAQQKHDDNKAKLCRHLNELNERLNQKEQLMKNMKESDGMITQLRSDYEVSDCA